MVRFDLWEIKWEWDNVHIRTQVRIYCKIRPEPSGLPRAQAIFYHISLLSSDTIQLDVVKFGNINLVHW